MRGRATRLALATVLSVTATGHAMTAIAQSSTTSDIDGLFDVGGHELYLNCQGTGSPTIVYLHGAIWSTDEVPIPHANGEFAQREMSDDFRVCVYDRRNVGMSDTVDAPQHPEDAIADLHDLLTVAGAEPPYVLLGASFGGVLSYLYANTYSEDVVGMVLLDSMIPDELSLDAYFPPEERFEAFDAEDESETPERISHFKALSAAQPYIGQEPAIPVTYLNSLTDGYGSSEIGIPEFDEQIVGLLEAYVGRFAPGTLIYVGSPHFMEAAIPDQIVEALRQVIEEAGY